ncbi:unnamed protein product [Amoebophrya sp. A120]|nr:unnamed protein product [Amoebophrya sp. A120]|eukprot:GSA120T00009663001.1
MVTACNFLLSISFLVDWVSVLVVEGLTQEKPSHLAATTGPVAQKSLEVPPAAAASESTTAVDVAAAAESPSGAAEKPTPSARSFADLCAQHCGLGKPLNKKTRKRLIRAMKRSSAEEQVQGLRSCIKQWARPELVSTLLKKGCAWRTVRRVDGFVREDLTLDPTVVESKAGILPVPSSFDDFAATVVDTKEPTSETRTRTVRPEEDANFYVDYGSRPDLFPNGAPPTVAKKTSAASAGSGEASEIGPNGELMEPPSGNTRKEDQQEQLQESPTTSAAAASTTATTTATTRQKQRMLRRVQKPKEKTAEDFENQYYAGNYYEKMRHTGPEFQFLDVFHEVLRDFVTISSGSAEEALGLLGGGGGAPGGTASQPRGATRTTQEQPMENYSTPQDDEDLDSIFRNRKSFREETQRLHAYLEAFVMHVGLECGDRCSQLNGIWNMDEYRTDTRRLLETLAPFSLFFGQTDSRVWAVLSLFHAAEFDHFGQVFLQQSLFQALVVYLYIALMFFLHRRRIYQHAKTNFRHLSALGIPEVEAESSNVGDAKQLVAGKLKLDRISAVRERIQNWIVKRYKSSLKDHLQVQEQDRGETLAICDGNTTRDVISSPDHEVVTITTPILDRKNPALSLGFTAFQNVYQQPRKPSEDALQTPAHVRVLDDEKSTLSSMRSKDAANKPQEIVLGKSIFLEGRHQSSTTSTPSASPAIDVNAQNYRPGAEDPELPEVNQQATDLHKETQGQETSENGPAAPIKHQPEELQEGQQVALPPAPPELRENNLPTPRTKKILNETGGSVTDTEDEETTSEAGTKEVGEQQGAPAKREKEEQHDLGRDAGATAEGQDSIGLVVNGTTAQVQPSSSSSTTTPIDAPVSSASSSSPTFTLEDDNREQQQSNITDSREQLNTSWILDPATHTNKQHQFRSSGSSSKQHSQPSPEDDHPPTEDENVIAIESTRGHTTRYRIASKNSIHMIAPNHDEQMNTSMNKSNEPILQNPYRKLLDSGSNTNPEQQTNDLSSTTATTSSARSSKQSAAKEAAAPGNYSQILRSAASSTSTSADEGGNKSTATLSKQSGGGGVMQLFDDQRQTGPLARSQEDNLTDNLTSEDNIQSNFSHPILVGHNISPEAIPLFSPAGTGESPGEDQSDSNTSEYERSYFEQTPEVVSALNYSVNRSMMLESAEKQVQAHKKRVFDANDFYLTTPVGAAGMDYLEENDIGTRGVPPRPYGGSSQSLFGRDLEDPANSRGRVLEVHKFRFEKTTGTGSTPEEWNSASSMMLPGGHEENEKSNSAQSRSSSRNSSKQVRFQIDNDEKMPSVPRVVDSNASSSLGAEVDQLGIFEAEIKKHSDTQTSDTLAMMKREFGAASTAAQDQVRDELHIQPVLVGSTIAVMLISAPDEKALFGSAFVDTRGSSDSRTRVDNFLEQFVVAAPAENPIQVNKMSPMISSATRPQSASATFLPAPISTDSLSAHDNHYSALTGAFASAASASSSISSTPQRSHGSLEANSFYEQGAVTSEDGTVTVDTFFGEGLHALLASDRAKKNLLILKHAICGFCNLHVSLISHFLPDFFSANSSTASWCSGFAEDGLSEETTFDEKRHLPYIPSDEEIEEDTSDAGRSKDGPSNLQNHESLLLQREIEKEYEEQLRQSQEESELLLQNLLKDFEKFLKIVSTVTVFLWLHTTNRLFEFTLLFVASLLLAAASGIFCSGLCDVLIFGPDGGAHSLQSESKNEKENHITEQAILSKKRKLILVNWNSLFGVEGTSSSSSSTDEEQMTSRGNKSAARRTTAHQSATTSVTKLQAKTEDPDSVNIVSVSRVESRKRRQRLLEKRKIPGGAGASRTSGAATPTTATVPELEKQEKPGAAIKVDGGTSATSSSYSKPDKHSTTLVPATTSNQQLFELGPTFTEYEKCAFISLFCAGGAALLPTVGRLLGILPLFLYEETDKQAQEQLLGKWNGWTRFTAVSLDTVTFLVLLDRFYQLYMIVYGCGFVLAKQNSTSGKETAEETTSKSGSGGPLSRSTSAVPRRNTSASARSKNQKQNAENQITDLEQGLEVAPTVEDEYFSVDAANQITDATTTKMGANEVLVGGHESSSVTNPKRDRYTTSFALHTLRWELLKLKQVFKLFVFTHFLTLALLLCLVFHQMFLSGFLLSPGGFGGVFGGSGQTSNAYVDNSLQDSDFKKSSFPHNPFNANSGPDLKDRPFGNSVQNFPLSSTSSSTASAASTASSSFLEGSEQSEQQRTPPDDEVQFARELQEADNRRYLAMSNEERAKLEVEQRWVAQEARKWYKEQGWWAFGQYSLPPNSALFSFGEGRWKIGAAVFAYAVCAFSAPMYVAAKHLDTHGRILENLLDGGFSILIVCCLITMLGLAEIGQQVAEMTLEATALQGEGNNAGVGVAAGTTAAAAPGGASGNP